MTPKCRISRRAVLLGSAAAVAAPWLMPRAVLGDAEKAAPGERIGVGMIGMGRQALHANLRPFLNSPHTQVVAVCDVDAWRLDQALQAVQKAYSETRPSGEFRGCAAVKDFREVLARKDVDAVMISTPDHWHVPMALAAVEAGKDVCLEKPITRSIAEGRALADAVARHKRVFRVDSEFRSIAYFHRACELVRNGRIGKLRRVEVGVPAGDNVDCPHPAGATMPVSPDLDYDAWQGPAPRAPYHQERVHPPRSYGRPGWMRHLYYCDGMITNWGSHLCDIAQWGAGSERTGPVEIEGTGVWPPAGKLWNVLKTFTVRYRFESGLEMTYRTEAAFVRFEGSKGWIEARYGREGIKAEPASVLDSKIGPDETRLTLKNEKDDFIDAVRTRGRTVEDEEVGHRTTSLCHLGHVAIWLGQKLAWDPNAEKFAGSDAANEMVARPIHGMPKG